ncbi:hypothetical protein JTE90_005886 [Oedothorax gibbosus]|uniref:Uncharacterized protein n=1 Tax=Oedothorax gibbosus TaxID=931172 RepID=A0AAV6TNJ4_9ARAC|nr:hypothetical protein JTE90_005886 [Oedothorax gibbosus]
MPWVRWLDWKPGSGWDSRVCGCILEVAYGAVVPLSPMFFTKNVKKKGGQGWEKQNPRVAPIRVISIPGF